MTRTAPELARALAVAVSELGGRALIVGGWVRDDLLDRPPKDLDLEIFGIAADQLLPLVQRFGRVDTVGESFTVYKLGDIDVSLPRRESKIGRGHKGFEVTGDPTLSILEAARRRDFTINAISRDPLTGALLDPFDGQQDLAARRLRVVDPQTFGDDSLRVLRALQLTARFELHVDDDTKILLRSVPLDDLPAERIWGEFEKLLLLAERPSLGLALARELGVIDRLLPAVVPIIGCPQDPQWHPEGDVWTHTLMVVDEARRRLDDLTKGPALAMMLAALCHDLGKPGTTAVIDGRVRSPGHEEAGVGPTTAVLDALHVYTLDGYDTRRTVLGLVTEHLRPLAFATSATPPGDGAFRRLARRVDLDLLARFAEADCRGRTGSFDCSGIEAFRARARALGVEHAPPAPLVRGRDLLALGMSPGPGVGAVLQAIYERQLDGEVATREEGLALARALAESHTA